MNLNVHTGIYEKEAANLFKDYNFKRTQHGFYNKVHYPI